MAEIRIKNLASWCEESLGRRGFGKNLEEVSEGK
jgi:hypothetical protein